MIQNKKLIKYYIQFYSLYGHSIYLKCNEVRGMTSKNMNMFLSATLGFTLYDHIILLKFRACFWLFIKRECQNMSCKY